MSAERSANRIVEYLEQAGVKYVFGVPGAKIDQVYDALLDSSIELVVCRHEQDAAFMAQAIGRITGTPGVVLVTSGPGTTNLATGLLTATTEGDPVLALCGAVPRKDRLKHTHQSMDAVGLLRSVTKYVGEVDDPDNVPEAMANAFRAAQVMPRGAAALVLPADVMAQPTSVQVSSHRVPKLGGAPETDVEEAARRISEARFPVILAGMRAACEGGALAIRELVGGAELPVVETFQAAGIVSRELENRFFGRVGLFRNQPGDVLLDRADVVLAIGYDAVEYEPRQWNATGSRTIINLDEIPAEADADYAPALELRGDIPSTVLALAGKLRGWTPPTEMAAILRKERERLDAPDTLPVAAGEIGVGLDPAAVTRELRDAVDDATTVISDVGSHYIYMARYFRTYEPRHLLFSNGQQTLGVALPWAMATALVRPGEPVLSVSGDGGFLFSSMELETAVRLGLGFVHVIFDDGTYDMVAFQQRMKYGRTSGVELGHYDVVSYAKAFGARGFRVRRLDELGELVRAELTTPGPTIIDVPVDYRANVENLAGDLLEGVLS